MQTGYSIFGGPVETMDGPVRPVSIQPRFVGSGPAYPGAGPAPIGTGPRYAGSGPAYYPGAGPAHHHHHHHHPMQGYGQTSMVAAAAAAPPPPPMQAWNPQTRIAAPMARGGGRPPMQIPSVPPPVPMPMSTMPRYAHHHRHHHPQGPASYPGPYDDCGCQEPMPLRGPIHFYNPTPSSPISPTYGSCPLPAVAPMTDGCGNPIQMVDDCGNPISGAGVYGYHPGGAYPITERGPGLNDGLTRRQVLHGQLPVGAGTDIFGGTVSALDPMRGRPIGPPCGSGVGSRVQPQTPYNHPLECHHHIPGTGHGAGVFRPLRGYGGGPDGLGGVSQAAAGFGAVPLHWFCYTPFGERTQRCVPSKLPF